MCVLPLLASLVSHLSPSPTSSLVSPSPPISAMTHLPHLPHPPHPSHPAHPPHLTHSFTHAPTHPLSRPATQPPSHSATQPLTHSPPTKEPRCPRGALDCVNCRCVNRPRRRRRLVVVIGLLPVAQDPWLCMCTVRALKSEAQNRSEGLESQTRCLFRPQHALHKFKAQETITH